jgi:hypothetical protein
VATLLIGGRGLDASLKRRVSDDGLKTPHLLSVQLKKQQAFTGFQDACFVLWGAIRVTRNTERSVLSTFSRSA